MPRVPCEVEAEAELNKGGFVALYAFVKSVIDERQDSQVLMEEQHAAG